MVRVYLDDIPVFAVHTAAHIATVARVFKVLREHKLLSRAKKYESRQRTRSERQEDYKRTAVEATQEHQRRPPDLHYTT